MLTNHLAEVPFGRFLHREAILFPSFLHCPLRKQVTGTAHTWVGSYAAPSWEHLCAFFGILLHGRLDSPLPAPIYLFIPLLFIPVWTCEYLFCTLGSSSILLYLLCTVERVDHPYFMLGNSEVVDVHRLLKTPKALCSLTNTFEHPAPPFWVVKQPLQSTLYFRLWNAVSSSPSVRVPSPRAPSALG